MSENGKPQYGRFATDSKIEAFLLGSLAAQRGEPNLHRHDSEFMKLLARNTFVEEWNANQPIPDDSKLWIEWNHGWRAHKDFLNESESEGSE